MAFNKIIKIIFWKLKIFNSMTRRPVERKLKRTHITSIPNVSSHGLINYIDDKALVELKAVLETFTNRRL